MSERGLNRQQLEDIYFHSEPYGEFIISAKLPVKPSKDTSKYDEIRINQLFENEEIIRITINGIPARVVDFIEEENESFLVVNFYSEDIRKTPTKFDSPSW